MGFEYLKNGTQVRFNYPCSRLGGKYKFTINVKDDLNQQYSSDFEVKFYTTILEAPANESRPAPEYFISSDNKFLWFLGFDHYTLFKIALDDFKIVEAIKMDFMLRHMTFNSFNKMIYLLSTDNKIRVFDPETNKIRKTIEVKSDPVDEERLAINLPYALSFSSSGLGILSIGATIGWVDWRLIDSKKNDEIYPMPNRSKDHNLEGKSFVSADGKKIYTLSDDNKFYTFDGYTQEITWARPPVHGRLAYLYPNKKSGLMMFLQTYEQYLYNPNTGYLSKVSY